MHPNNEPARTLLLASSKGVTPLPPTLLERVRAGWHIYSIQGLEALDRCLDQWRGLFHFN
jgi:hypothetical protein